MWEHEKPCRQCADEADRQVTMDGITYESHKTITQINHTNQSHKSTALDGMMSQPRIENHR